MRRLPLALLLCAFSSVAAESELALESDFVRESEEAFEPELEELEQKAEMESIRLEEWGEEDSWWLGRWADLSSQAAPRPPEMERERKGRPGLLNGGLQPLDTAALSPPPPQVTPVRARLALDFAHKDQTAVVARPLVAVRLLQRAEISSAVTLVRSRGETTLSYPETAASLQAVREKGLLPALLLRAAIVTPVSGSALVSALGARTTKRLGPAHVHGSADYITEAHNSRLYTLGLAADTPIGERLLLRGNAFYQSRFEEPEGTLTGEGGMSFRVTSRVLFDGSVRVQHGPVASAPHLFVGVSIL